MLAFFLYLQNERFGIMTKLTTEDFIKKAKEVHGDKYDYSKVEYTNIFGKLCIKCPEHGEQQMELSDLL